MKTIGLIFCLSLALGLIFLSTLFGASSILERLMYSLLLLWAMLIVDVIIRI